MSNFEALIQHPVITFLPKTIIIMLLTYLAFKVLDFITGLLKTWMKVVPYQSAVMRHGLILWIAEMVGIMFVFIIDLALGMNFYLTGFTLGLFIYKEGGSIAENLRAVGVEMPGVVDVALEQFDKTKEHENKTKKEDDK